MKKQINKIIVFLIFSLFIFSSCRDEYIIDEFDSNNTILTANSEVTDLARRVSLKDGSKDNIIDKANCISIELPVTVIVNGVEIIINSEDDFRDIEIIFDEDDNDVDNLEIIFPVTIVLSDFTKLNVNSQSELDGFINNCNGEDEIDDDIECVDFKYPMDITVFDTVTEQKIELVINDDEQLHSFIKNLDDDDVASIQFPIVIILFDGTEISINSIKGLENIINEVKDNCDEDDNNNFNDDDCENCSQQDMLDAFASCSAWTVNQLKLGTNELGHNYKDYFFNFSNDGTITVQENNNTYTGTWSSSESGQDMIIIIDIPTLPDFNGNWILHNIVLDSDGLYKKIELRVDDNRLRFKTTC